MTFILIMIAAYLLGSLSSAVIVCRLMHLPDPRTLGSKNPGATNVLRIGGKIAALLTLLGDTLKGTFPVLLGMLFNLDTVELTAVAAAAFIGHLFPIFFHFQGGKGVATFIGGLIALNGFAGLSWVSLWLIIAAIFRYSSLAALIASALAPVYFYYFTQSMPAACLLLGMVLFLIYRHHHNIANLIQGKETKIGKR